MLNLKDVKMIKLLILNLFLLNVAHVLSFPEVTPSNDNNGPVSNIMENLAEHTASVTKDRLALLLEKNEYISKTFENDIKEAITSALNELKQPIEDFQRKISSSQCQPLITIEELNQQIDSDLSKCMQNLNDILKRFQQDANDLKIVLEKSIEKIMALPTKCKNVKNGDGLDSEINCYIDNITDFNTEIASMLNSIGKTLAQARHLAETALQDGRTCANKVIITTKDSLDKILANCQITDK